jgi:hypothetical protein
VITAGTLLLSPPARAARWGFWWIPGEAPGGIGSPELWMDCAALDGYGRGYATVPVTVSRAHPGTWIDAIVRFSSGDGAPCAYIVEKRRTSQANLGRPFYVMRMAG